MEKRKFERKGKDKKKRLMNQTEVSAKATSYSGPVRFPFEYRQQDLHTTVCTLDQVLASDGAGQIATVFGSYASSASGWSNLIAVFDEYRTLAMELKYIPLDRYNRGVSVSTGPIYTVVDYDTATALSSFADASKYASFRPQSLDVPWVQRAYMNGVENAQFLNTATPSSTIYIKVYSSGNTFTTNYGRVVISYRIQFRGKGE